MTLKEIKTRVKAINAILIEMEMSHEEIIEFWNQCLLEAQPEPQTLNPKPLK